MRFYSLYFVNVLLLLLFFFIDRESVVFLNLLICQSTECINLLKIVFYIIQKLNYKYKENIKPSTSILYLILYTIHCNFSVADFHLTKHLWELNKIRTTFIWLDLTNFSAVLICLVAHDLICVLIWKFRYL